MCRILFVKSNNEFSVSEYLGYFSEISKMSKEFQGHGWGCSYLVGDKWKHYKNINPIWEDNFNKFGNTKRLLVHARSAFRDQGIKVENNMPFYDEENVFIFNGELNGVKINSDGRIGAEKIFNFIKRFSNYGLETAVKKAVPIIKKRSNYVRAMNLVIATMDAAIVSSDYNEDPNYFQMSKHVDDEQIVICSQPFPKFSDWTKIDNNSIEVY